MTPAPDPRYIPPDCPAPDPAADWQEMGWCCRECAAIAHLVWCPHRDPGTPIPFTLTAKAHAALDQDGTR